MIKNINWNWDWEEIDSYENKKLNNHLHYLTKMQFHDSYSFNLGFDNNNYRIFLFCDNNKKVLINIINNKIPQYDYSFDYILNIKEIEYLKSNNNIYITPPFSKRNRLFKNWKLSYLSNLFYIKNVNC